MSARVRSPEFPPQFPWLNTDRPLTLQSLKGRVVLLDFWTYCCINCLHVLPDLKYLERKYRDSLTVIGVHSAKFDNEKEIENIRQAILRYDIEHPVIVDRNFEVWEQYAVRAWPTIVVIDPQGYCIGHVAGEGNREALDEAIADLLQQHQSQGTTDFQAIPFTLEKQTQPLTTPLAFPGKVLADETTNRLFIADTGHHRIVVATLEGEVLHVIGTGNAGLADGSFDTAQFFAPQGMAWDAKHQLLYIADTENHALRQIDFTRQEVSTIAGTGKQRDRFSPESGEALEVPLNSPWDIVLIEDILLVAMAGCHQIWGMDLGDRTIGIYAGSGGESCIDGTLDEAAFAQPSGLATDGTELFVADSESSSIRGVGLEEDAIVRTLCGSGELFGFGDVDGTGEAVRLQHCLGVEYAAGWLWVADTYNHKIKQVNPQTGFCQTVLGTGEDFREPSGLSVAGSNLYIADTNHHRICRVDLAIVEIEEWVLPGLCAPQMCGPDRNGY